MDAGPQLPLENVLREVSPLLESPDIEKIGQNIKYDIAVLKEAGHEVRGPLFDTMLASYLLLSSRRSHGMDHLAQEYFGVTTIKYADLCGKGAKEIPFSHVPVEAAAPYACQDADITYRLALEMAPQLEKDGLMNLFEELEVPLLRVLLEMERAGHPAGSGVFAEYGQGTRSAPGADDERHPRAGGRGVQYQLHPAVARHPVRKAELARD